MKPGFYKLNIQISNTLGSVAIHRPSSVITMFADVLVPNWHQAINSIHAASILVILAQESYISRGTDVMLQLLNKQWSRRAGGWGWGVGVRDGPRGSATLFFFCVCVCVCVGGGGGGGGGLSRRWRAVRSPFHQPTQRRQGQHRVMFADLFL